MTGLLRMILTLLYILPLNLCMSVVHFLSIPTIFFSKRRFQWINHQCFHFFTTTSIQWFRKCNNFSPNYLGETPITKQNAILITNHQSTVDIIIILDFLIKKQYKGTAKFFLKESLKYIPIVGWRGKFLEFIFLKRHWIKDKDYIHKMLHRYTKYTTPYCITIFPEGTRANPEKIQAYYKMKQKKQSTKYTLPPRIKGFITTVEYLRDHIQVVYDLTIAYPQKPYSLIELLLGRIKPIDVYIKTFPIASLPQNNEELQKWLEEIFKKKEEKLQSHYSPPTE